MNEKMSEQNVESIELLRLYSETEGPKACRNPHGHMLRLHKVYEGERYQGFWKARGERNSEKRVVSYCRRLSCCLAIDLSNWEVVL